MGSTDRFTNRCLGLLAIGAMFSPAASLWAGELTPNAMDQAFKGQSRFLAMAAEQALADYQSDKAVLLALNALPGAYGGDRPVVPAARLALHRAIHQLDAIKKVEVEEDPMFAVVSPGTSYVAVVPKDAEIIEVFEAASGERVLRIEHDDVVAHAAFSGDDRLLATLGEDGLRLWDLDARSQFAHYYTREQQTVAVTDSNEDQPLSAVFQSLSLQPVDLPQIGGTSNRDDQLPLVAFSKDGERVAFASPRGGVEIRLIGNGDSLHAEDIDPKFLYFAEDDARVMVLDRSRDEFVAVDAATGEIETLAQDVIIAKAMENAEGITLAGVENGHLILFDAGGERFAKIETPPWRPEAAQESAEPRGSLTAGTSVALGPDLVAGGTWAGVLVWDLEKKTQLEHFRGGKITGLAVSPNGGYLVAGSTEGEIRLWDTDAFGSKWVEAESMALSSHADRVVHVGFAGNGEYVVSLARDRSMIFRKLPSRKRELADWELNRNPAVLSRDGRLVTRYDDRINTLKVWDARSGERLSTIERIMQPLGRNSFHPERAQLVGSNRVGSYLGAELPGAEILDLDSAEVIVATDGRQSLVDRSIYAMDGRRVLTANTGEEPSFSIWNASNGRLLRHVEDEHLLAAAWQGSLALTRSGQDLILRDLRKDSTVTLVSIGLDTPAEALAADFSDQGERVLIRQGMTLQLWDTESRELVDSHTVQGLPMHFGISADGDSWFVVVDGELTVREGGETLDRMEAEKWNLLFALVGDRVATVTLGGSLIETSIPETITIEDAIARLPVGRTCLTPQERREYDLPVLTDEQWKERGCPQFASGG